MLLFLSTMTMVTLSDHIMVMWIAIEATTLASAPLIYTHRSAATLEATWKYVLICSVGIALALLGTVLITLSMDIGGVDVPLAFSALTREAGRLDPLWLKTGFVFILVGYGTKMGLAPMHTWLPDAHSEAPSPASALLSGVLLNCAYLGIFKTNKIMHAAGLGPFFEHDSDRIGSGIHPGGGNLYSQTDRVQAAAGLFEYRKHGHHRLRHRHRRVGRLWCHAVPDPSQPDQIIPVSVIRQHPAGLRQSADQRNRATCRTYAEDLCGLFRRVCRYFRVSALRNFHRRAIYHHRCLSQRTLYRSGNFYAEPVCDFRRICQARHADFFQ